jgi:rhodanese-related sulfurtransferase
MMKPAAKTISFIGVMLGAASLAFAVEAKELEVKITPEMAYTTVTHEGELIKIQRIQDTEHNIEGGFAKTSRPCPPFCINPIALHEGVTTVGEIEVIKFMEGPYCRGRGVIIDARTPSWFERGTIPGSVNIPFTEFEKPADDPALAEILESLGAKERHDVSGVLRAIESLGLMDGDQKTDSWDFSEAKDLLLWCNGPWCGQSPRAIKGLLAVGYPPEKLYYYRGGMQLWQSLGLTTVKPKTNEVAAK